MKKLLTTALLVCALPASANGLLVVEKIDAAHVVYVKEVTDFCKDIANDTKTRMVTASSMGGYDRPHVIGNESYESAIISCTNKFRNIELFMVQQGKKAK
ncbi:hypothetical protein VPHD479_0328 [Vibrio phage D479]